MSPSINFQPQVFVEELEIMEAKKRAARTYTPGGDHQDHHTSPKKQPILPAESQLVTGNGARSSEGSIQSISTISITSTAATTETMISQVDFGRDISSILCADALHSKGFLPDTLQHLETPANFGIIVPGIFRSSYPRTAANFAFIKALSLKTIVTLVDDELPEGFQELTTSNAIRHIVIGMKGTKKAAIPLDTMRDILRVVLDEAHHPLLVHCNQGKHRTGCVAGIIKKASGWSAAKVVEEYISFATPKVRDTDVAYLTGFDLADLSNLFPATPLAVQGRRVSPFKRILAGALVCIIIWCVTLQKIADPEIDGTIL